MKRRRPGAAFLHLQAPKYRWPIPLNPCVPYLLKWLSRQLAVTRPPLGERPEDGVMEFLLIVIGSTFALLLGYLAVVVWSDVARAL